MKRLTFDINEQLFLEFKTYCVKHKISIKDLLTKIIQEKLNQS